MKVRGYLVDLTAVEEALLSFSGVSAAACVARGEALFAFFTAAAASQQQHLQQQVSVSPAALREACAARLPPFAVPAAFVELPALPLGPTGKCDRKRLRVPSTTGAEDEEVGAALPSSSPAPTSTAAAAAGSPLSASALLPEVSALFAAALPHPPPPPDASVSAAPVRPEADFLLLGGHSLAAARFLGSLLRRFGPAAAAAASLAAFLSEPTPRATAERLAAALGGCGGGGGASAGDKGDAELVARDLALPVCGEEGDASSSLEESEEAGSGRGRVLLLTGAAGFLGRHVLAQLLSRLRAAAAAADSTQQQQPPPFDCVLCVVRAAAAAGRPTNASPSAAATERLRAAFSSASGGGGDTFQWALDSGALRVHVGDLTEARLGLPDGAWRGLRRSLSAVLHCAARVNMSQPYAALSRDNCAATAALLRLASEAAREQRAASGRTGGGGGGGVAFHLVSTSAAIPPGRWSASSSSPLRAEGAPPPGAAGAAAAASSSSDGGWEDLRGGYARTKWVAEALATRWAGATRGQAHIHRVRKGTGFGAATLAVSFACRDSWRHSLMREKSSPAPKESHHRRHPSHGRSGTWAPRDAGQ